MDQIKDLLPAVLRLFETPDTRKKGKLIDSWSSIAGPKIGPHTKPFLKDTELIVWVDQSALAFEIRQKHLPSLLKRAQAVMGEEVIKNIRIKVGQLR